ncbi:MAG: CRISPR-associated endonuclease Cas1 [Oligoflexia bacterium]|nr:CRISPR-associated endonuclease Cas1 [Oligoflexia bacterium]
MLNESVYCPRLFALEHVHGEWADSSDTVEGRTVHRRVDRPSASAPPEPQEDPERPVTTRSVRLADPELGLVAVLDLLESQGGKVVPVDYKRGSPAPNPQQAYEPERIQVAAQVLLLRAHGYTCDYGELYFAKARRRVRVDVDAQLEERTLQAIASARQIEDGKQLPPPLVDSPKCPRCSLVGICLPDEHQHLLGNQPRVRPLVAARDDGQPLYVQLVHGSLGKRGGEIVVRDKEGIQGTARFEHTTQVVVFGNVSLTTPLMQELCARGIPASLHSYGGWFRGMVLPAGGHNVHARRAQHAASADPRASLKFSCKFIRAKTANARTMLRRNHAEPPRDVLLRLKELRDELSRAPDLAVLRGLEGVSARLYFQNFAGMLKGQLGGRFDFNGRNRRPPKDPVNSMLSFAYACLAREITTVLHRIGLDPFVGFLHQVRAGRPALALDLMEEFRPIIADSAVLWAVNNGVVQPDDFVVATVGVNLKKPARKRFIEVYERRLDDLVTHPIFGTRISYRRVIEIQARLLIKVLLGELPEYPGFQVR